MVNSSVCVCVCVRRFEIFMLLVVMFWILTICECVGDWVAFVVGLLQVSTKGK